jgi:hypothetical protein
VFISDKCKKDSDAEDSSSNDIESISEQPNYDLGFLSKNKQSGLGFILDDIQCE